MNQQEILQKTAAYVKLKMEDDSSGHDWWHVYSVWNNARMIGKKENADMFVVELAALLHDLGDYKFYNGDETMGPKLSREWLEQLEVDEQVIAHVCDIINDMSFKGAGVKIVMKTLEGKVVQDADRLDAIGAIGIARTFAFGGSRGRRLYDPMTEPVMHKSFAEYKNMTNGTTINHFYEKLLLLKDLMNTETGKKLAAERHRFMEHFLEQFFKEWEGKGKAE